MRDSQIESLKRSKSLGIEDRKMIEKDITGEEMKTEGRKEGRNERREEGREEGRKEGMKEGRKERGKVANWEGRTKGKKEL